MRTKNPAMAKNAKPVPLAQASAPRAIQGDEALNDGNTRPKPASRGRSASAKPAAVAAGSSRGASKLSRLEKLLRRPKGATVTQLAEALGWQKHSVRGAMSGTLKKRGLGIVSKERKGERFYRITS